MVAVLPSVAVDDRQDERYTAALRGHFSVVTKHLSCGDIVWGSPLGTVGVEDKDVADLGASMRNGRLDDELRRLVATYAIPVLMIRGRSLRSQHITLEEGAIEKLKFGRQLHGVYVFQTGRDMDEAALGLWDLWDYLSKAREHGIEGVRREPKWKYQGPMSPRAEALYGILGGVKGIKGRREIAQRIAKNTPLSQFMQWVEIDFQAAGFSRHMAKALTTHLVNMERG